MSHSFLLVVALLALTGFNADALPWPHRCNPAWCTAAEKKDESVIRDAINNAEAQHEEDVFCHCSCEPPVGEEKKLLHVTACSEAVAYAELMISNPPGCNVDVEDSNDNTPLHEAAGCCNTPMAFVFLSGGDDPDSSNKADPESRNLDDETPMCVAALQDDANCAGIVKHLVEFKADICTKCPDPNDPSKQVLPYDLAVNKIVKDTIEQLGGRLVADGGEC